MSRSAEPGAGIWLLSRTERGGGDSYRSRRKAKETKGSTFHRIGVVYH